MRPYVASIPQDNAPNGFLEEVMSGLKGEGDKAYIYIYVYILR